MYLDMKWIATSWGEGTQLVAANFENGCIFVFILNFG